MVRPSLILCALLLLGACGDLTTFPVSVDIPEQHIEGSTLGAIGELLPRDLLDPLTVDMSQEEEFKKQDVKHVESIKLTALRLTLTPESVQRNFDFFDSITVDALSRDGSKSVRVAAIAPVPKGLDSLPFNVTQAELVAVLGVDFNLAFSVSGRPPANDTIFDGRAAFLVEAKLF